MKTKTIFKALAMAMLMPAMLLTTACSNDDDAIVNNENTAKKGYTLPVTLNVTRQGDGGTTRATFNDGTKKLEFSAGDKLFVKGCYNEGEYTFAGTLTWVSEGTFSGTITTQTEWTGTFEELLSAEAAEATLLPAGYESYGFLSINEGSGYDAYLIEDFDNAFATSKAAAVEQLSFEYCNEYSSGFTLTPCNAILNFTITGLTASTEVAVEFTYPSTTVSKNVDTDASGNATFAIGVMWGTDLNDCSLTVGGNAITLVSSSKELAAGKIYNIERSAAPAETTVTWTASDMEYLILDEGVTSGNSIKGITVTESGLDINSWKGTKIEVQDGNATFTFTSSVGNIKSIVITAENINMSEVPSGWALDDMSSPNTLTWSGTPSATVSLHFEEWQQSIENISTIEFTVVQ